jgi:hypothetical protein
MMRDPEDLSGVDLPASDYSAIGRRVGAYPHHEVIGAYPHNDVIGAYPHHEVIGAYPHHEVIGAYPHHEVIGAHETGAFEIVGAEDVVGDAKTGTIIEILGIDAGVGDLVIMGGDLFVGVDELGQAKPKPKKKKTSFFKKVGKVAKGAGKGVAKGAKKVAKVTTRTFKSVGDAAKFVGKLSGQAFTAAARGLAKIAALPIVRTLKPVAQKKALLIARQKGYEVPTRADKLAAQRYVVGNLKRHGNPLVKLAGAALEFSRSKISGSDIGQGAAEVSALIPPILAALKTAVIPALTAAILTEAKKLPSRLAKKPPAPEERLSLPTEEAPDIEPIQISPRLAQLEERLRAKGYQVERRAVPADDGPGPEEAEEPGSAAEGAVSGWNWGGTPRRNGWVWGGTPKRKWGYF